MNYEVEGVKPCHRAHLILKILQCNVARDVKGLHLSSSDTVVHSRWTRLINSNETDSIVIQDVVFS